ncbi:class I SAM-dependent methyltransferase [Phenylobacterium aquaticum]|uniref:class I SAM-dependent methyltransferase n=1 Tax=Phenylobacterium aquaticum TaxID=1763816 RepID=UPI001F5E30DB|nr:class I SAM-dependent methyltransferase [Phenylobacterium aquaticum]MCI3130786.1 methyltransferase domain-containing protein [Phenylobacterium aquaticum]
MADLQRAVALLNGGEWDQAQLHAERVLAVRPADPSAQNVLGTVAMNTGRAEDALTWFERAAAGQPRNPFIQFNLGEAHRRMLAYPRAAKFFQRAAALKPDFAEAHAAAGDIFRMMGQGADAERSYQSALRQSPALLNALNGYGLLLLQRGDLGSAATRFQVGCANAPIGHPMRPTLLTNLGVSLLHLGQGLPALNALAQAVEAAQEDDEGWRRLASALRDTRVAPGTAAFRGILLRLFERVDINPRNLATAAIAVLRQDENINALLDAIAAAPRALGRTLEQRADAASQLVQDPLFQTLLAAAPIPDAAIELLLVQLRADLLTAAHDEPASLEEELSLVVAIARQAFLNEYVFFTGAEEQGRVDALIAQLDHDEFECGAGVAARIAVVAAYRPLTSTPLAARLHDLNHPALADLLCEQLVEPAEEARLRSSLPLLKPAADATSLAVQQQYEQNPYPRWTRCSLGVPLPFRAAVQSALPELPAREIPETEAPRVLIAGCGTGLETLRVAGAYRDASILAIDLSGASLGYAMRKSREYGLEVQHMQADILDLPALSERFDLIDSFGVIHHMAEPAKGLKVLSELLKPQGFIFLGLYSEIGRRAVVEARHHIAEKQYADTAEGIRALRRELMLAGAPAQLQDVVSPASDFWTLSDCRDLLFHVEEHRFTLPQIGDLLDAAGLEFLGVQFGHAADRTRYRAENRQAGAMRDLQRLHRHEVQHPEIFGDTYRLWARPKKMLR